MKKFRPFARSGNHGKMFAIALVASIALLCSAAWAAPQGKPVALPFEIGQPSLIMESVPPDAGRSLDAPGDIVDFDAALIAAGNYLKRFQADITEDNAGNGSGGSESPNDPDDAGWDWMLNWDTQAHFHSTAASPTNIYGATAQGLYYAYLATSDAGYWTALLDAADHMVAVGDNIRSGADVKFLMLFDDLYDVKVGPTSTYVNAAKSKYDGRITTYGSAGNLARYIRDARHGQGYDNGIIAWDVGIWAVCAQMLDDRYGGTYDQDADSIAEVLWQDSFNDSPGYFDVVDDAGYDPTWANMNYWWYTGGLSGLIDAFYASGVHTDEIAGLITRLQASQHSNGAFSDSYGANPDDEDWQDTAYILMTLHNYNATAYATEIHHGAYWLGATQHTGGGWVYDSGNHYPEVGGECTAGLSFGSAPSEVWVDDDWHNQANVDAGHPGLVWGYDAFDTIQDGIDNVGSSTVNVAAGNYDEMLNVNKSVILRGANAGIHPAVGEHPTETVGTRGAETYLTHNGLYAIHPAADNITVDGFAFNGPNARIIDTYADANGFHLTNCIFADNTTSSGTGRIQFGGGSHTSCVFDFNLFQDRSNHMIYVGGGPWDGLNISYNKFVVESDAVFGANSSPLVGAVIQGNEFDGTVGGVPGSGFCGLNIGQGGNISIADNHFHHLYGCGFQVGIIGGSVTNNVFDHIYPYVGGTYGDVFQLWGGQWGTAVSTNVTISGNEIHYNDVAGAAYPTHGPRLRPCEGGSCPGIDASTIHINGNALISGGVRPDAFAIRHQGNAATTVDATCNWWGSLNYATILGKTQGLVDFDPWNDATLANCTYTDLNTYDFTLSFDDPYVSCGVSPCQTAVLKVAFDRANFVSGTLVITLPSNIIADWTGDQYQIMPPAGDRSTNLSFMNAAGGGTSTITLDVSWNQPYSTGAPNQYIAWLPVRSNSASNGTYPVTIASYDYWDMNQVQYDGTPNAFDFSLPNIYVDCIAPDVTLVGGAGEGSCAGYNDATAFTNALAMTFTNTGAPASTPLTAQIVMTRSDASTVTYTITPSNGTWPSAAVWSDMTLQGCYTFTLTATDATCNTSAPASVTVIKDTQAPVFNPAAYFTQGSPCYNNITGDPNKGATRLDAELNMNVDAPGTCETGGFTLMFTMGVNSLTPISGAPISGYPDATQSAALWSFIVANTVANYSGNVTVNWSLKDCLGNETTGSFVFCVDFALPDNTFTAFDARPTHLGVWLNWTWSASTGATEMEVWRKGEADYPVYAGNLSMSDDNYEKVHANLATNSWTMAATQTGAYTSAAYTGGSNIHHGTYWKDDIGVEGAPARSIYRYVTFVRDAVGNWSLATSYTLLTNADRSTNYWLGDYTADVANPAPYGIVDGIDLGLLSGVYFTTVSGGTPAFYDIGPENHENAVGKGIPNPDQVIDFQDLLPFSFNFGVVTPGGFNIHFPGTKPFSGLDEQPVVSVSRGEDVQLSVGDNFTVTVALSGNAEHSVKVVEAELHFDPQVLKFVSATEGAIEVMDGIPFALARPIEGRENAVGIAAAAMGEIACIAGDFALATIEFQWIREQTSTTEIELTSIQLADGHGNIIEGTATTLSINGADAVPLEFALYQNYPNPFNPSTQIRFDLADASEVRLVVFNLLGQKVRTLVAANMPAGRHQIAWDGRDDSGLDVSTGLYLYKLQAASFVSCRKMLLTR